LNRNPKSLCVITPRLPPAIDGIGDYCRQLWNQWPQENSSDEQSATEKNRWDFLVCEGAVESKRHWQEVDVFNFEKSTAGLLQGLAKTKSATVVLQYVGYGYDRDGQPVWLAEALSKWRGADPSRQLIVMFHETWATGRPWQRAFWHSHAQKRCAAELLSLASRVVTSNSATLRDLKSLNGNLDIDIIPIGASFSLQHNKEKNWRQLLVFGKYQSRLRALKMHSALIHELARLGLIDRIILAGESGTDDRLDKLISSWNLPIEIISCYDFPSDNLPDEILGSGISLMHTESTCLSKSTSFHLAALLGQVPITVEELDPGESLSRCEHYLSYRKQQRDEIKQELSDHKLLHKIATNLATLGTTCYSWQSIAARWRNVIASIQ
jgi:hypothetical protein